VVQPAVWRVVERFNRDHDYICAQNVVFVMLQHFVYTRLCALKLLC
jgi:hypothetical protein